jgi:hypothetical protein
VTTARPWICTTCNRVLRTITDVHGLTLAHGEQDPDDHPVVPVLAPEGWADGRCDFCNGQPVTHVVPARDFTYPPVPGQPAGYSHRSRGDWAACPACVELVIRDQWTLLRGRYRLGFEAQSGSAMPDVIDALIARLHGRLRANITGAPRPIQERKHR